MKNDSKTGFWKPGFNIFSDVLTQEERDQIAPFAAELATTSDPQRREELQKTINAIKTDFKTRRKNSKYGLFAKS